MDALPYVLAIGVFVVLLGIGINRLLERFDIRPVDPDASRGGFADFAEAIERWADKRRKR